MSIKNQKEMSHYLRIALIILVPVAAILLFCSIFVFSIKSVTLSGVPEEGYTLVRYTDHVEETLSAKVERGNSLASSKISWKSSDPEVAEVSEDGVVTGKNPGTVVITAKAKGNPFVKAQVKITVIQKALSMQIAFPEEIPSNEYYHLLHTGDQLPEMRARPPQHNFGNQQDRHAAHEDALHLALHFGVDDKRHDGDKRNQHRDQINFPVLCGGEACFRQLAW